MYNGSITFSSLGNANELITDRLNGFFFDFDDKDGRRARYILNLDKQKFKKYQRMQRK